LSGAARGPVPKLLSHESQREPYFYFVKFSIKRLRDERLYLFTIHVTGAGSESRFDFVGRV
jgi:hypothetical protein